MIILSIENIFICVADIIIKIYIKNMNGSKNIMRLCGWFLLVLTFLFLICRNRARKEGADDCPSSLAFRCAHCPLPRRERTHPWQRLLGTLTGSSRAPSAAQLGKLLKAWCSSEVERNLFSVFLHPVGDEENAEFASSGKTPVRSSDLA